MRQTIILAWSLGFAMLLGHSPAVAQNATIIQVIAADPRIPTTSPWNLEALSQPPSVVQWGTPTNGLVPMKYSGDSFGGRATKVFGWFASPHTLKGGGPNDTQENVKYPAIVLVHGGGGTAFPQWARMWAQRGYVAIAMDLSGHGPETLSITEQAKFSRMADGGPEQSDDAKFANMDQPPTEHWSYHAVANVIRAHSFLLSRSDVDPQRTAITGISWGGYLTCIAASLDPRFHAAVPVYGCGFLGDNSYWKPVRFDVMPIADRDRWLTLYDPSSYLPACRVPIFFVNGTNDFAYRIDSYMRSYWLVDGPKNIRVIPNMPHGHDSGWEPGEIQAFIESQWGGPALPRVTEIRFDPSNKPSPENGNRLVDSPGNVTLLAQWDAERPIAKAAIASTTGDGPINQRTWVTREVPVSGNTLSAEAPAADVTAWLLLLTDDLGRTVSSEVLFRPTETLEAGWTRLFDGVSLREWQTPKPEWWSIADGAITGTITKEHSPTLNQYLAWHQPMSDFELKLEFRLTGSTTGNTNGGFQFRSQILPNFDVAGYQVDNNFGQPWKARLYDEHGRHTLALTGEATTYTAQGERQVTPLALSPTANDFSLERWHTYHLTAIGHRLELRVNDQLLATVEDLDPTQFDASGILGLQLHTGPPMRAQFRNIRMKSIRADKE